MNHCRDCNSDYTTPGTCNCFAPGGKRHAAKLTTPCVPYVPIPYTPAYPWWQPSVTITTTPTTGTIWYNAGTAGQGFENGTTVTHVAPPLASFTAGGNCTA